MLARIWEGGSWLAENVGLLRVLIRIIRIMGIAWELRRKVGHAKAWRIWAIAHQTELLIRQGEYTCPMGFTKNPPPGDLSQPERVKVSIANKKDGPMGLTGKTKLDRSGGLSLKDLEKTDLYAQQ